VPLFAPLSGAFVGALDHFLTRGVPNGNVEEVLHGLWLVMAELMHQGLAGCAAPERRDDIGVADLGEFMILLGETLGVILQEFPLILSTTL
jgi:hypothetical protein